MGGKGRWLFWLFFRFLMAPTPGRHPGIFWGALLGLAWSRVLVSSFSGGVSGHHLATERLTAIAGGGCASTRAVLGVQQQEIRPRVLRSPSVLSVKPRATDVRGFQPPGQSRFEERLFHAGDAMGAEDAGCSGCSSAF